MDLPQQAASLPESPGVYIFKDAAGAVLYVGKANSLRNRVRSYFLESRWTDAKTGTLVREIAVLESIVVGNEREALALENNLIKQYRPKFNVLLRDDKTYPYIKFTAAEKFPRVYFTRKVRKDGAAYFGPYFPSSLARRVLHFVHKSFQIPSCTVDLTRPHPRPCLQFHIKRCLGPCVPGLVADAAYAQAAESARLFLAGRRDELIKNLQLSMAAASAEQRFEQAAGIRDLLRTLGEIEERQRIASAQGDDTDVLAFYAEPPLVAANLFHLRGGRVVDRREFYWEDLSEFDPAEFVPSLLKQLYLEAEHLPRAIHVPADFEDRALLEDALSDRAGRKLEISFPQRGPKRAFFDLVQKNAEHSFAQRFRVLKPTSRAISEALQSALNISELPERIECFDISHIQGTDVVASMVVWEKGRMKKSDYRKFIIQGAPGDGPSRNDDFAAIREAVTRRYRRLLDEKKKFPGLILIDGGIGQLHAAAQALETLQVLNQPLASIAKKEETLYVLGQENEPISLDRHSPVLHLVQQVRDECHRFAVTFHRQRRAQRQTHTVLHDIPGVGPRTAQILLREFGSVANLRRADLDQLSKFVPRARASKILAHLQDLSNPHNRPS
jgi:excinuclease ABC subunit C